MPKTGTRGPACPAGPSPAHSLKLLQLAHQFRLLLRSHAGKDSALDQDLGAQRWGELRQMRGGVGEPRVRKEQGSVWGDQGGLGQPYLGQQPGEVLHEDSKGGPTEGQVAGPGVWLHGVVCSLVRILGAGKLSSAPSAHASELGPGSGDTQVGSLVGCVIGTWGQPHLSPIHGCGGLHRQELKGGGLAPFRGRGMDNDQTLLGVHHAAVLGHSDRSLQVVPWGTWGKVRAQRLSSGASLTLT